MLFLFSDPGSLIIKWHGVCSIRIVLKNLIFSILLIALVSCQGPKGERGVLGDKGPVGPPGPPGTIEQNEVQGTTSGGGNFVHKNSTILLEKMKAKLVTLINNSSPGIYQNLGAGWTRETLSDLVGEIRSAPASRVFRNKSREVWIDYGRESNGRPYITILKPFFDYYSTIPVMTSTEDYLVRIQTQITLEILHEIAHLVLNHPKGQEVTERVVEEIEREASSFSQRFLIALLKDSVGCLSKNFNRYPLAEILKMEASDYLWIFPKHGSTAVIIKGSTVTPLAVDEMMNQLMAQPIEIKDLTYYPANEGLIAIAHGKAIFPPQIKIHNFFELFKADIVATSDFTVTEQDNSRIKFQISQFGEDYLQILPQLPEIKALKELLYGSDKLGKVNFGASSQSIEVKNIDQNEINSLFRYRIVITEANLASRSKATLDGATVPPAGSDKVIEGTLDLFCKPYFQTLLPREPLPSSGNCQGTSKCPGKTVGTLNEGPAASQ